MTRLSKIALSLALAPACLLAQYSYYYTDNLTSSGGSWTANGLFSETSAGFFSTSGGGGSLIYSYTMPGPSGEYEVATTLTLNPGCSSACGTYVSYLNASSTALAGSSPAGSFYDVELQNPAFSGGACSATLALNKYASSTFTTITSATVACNNGMVIRAVHIGGAQFIVYVNGVWTLYAADSTLTGGQPGVGAFGTASGNSITPVKLGQLDTTAPNGFNMSLIGTSSFSNRVDIQSPGTTDNTGGSGIEGYQFYRNGSYLSSPRTADFSDTTVSPSTTYTYQIIAFDFHLNSTASSTFNVTTPPSGGVDPRRVGVRSTGAYWGASPEQVDLLSGNMSYSLPLLKAQGRNGWGVGFALSYNSQNWRKDSGGTWDLGRDVGFGYGWKLLAGSLTPYWSSYYVLDHWTFTDSTGAEYRLTINSSGVWTSAESVYLSFDSNADILHFPDGSFWTMGAVSGGTEQDGGTYYPTVMEDTNGNQVLINYATGVAAAWSNSSARITSIEDVRAVNSGGSYWSYHFAYNSDSIPHLIGISNNISTGETYSFSYFTASTLFDPFSGGAGAYGSVGFLQKVVLANGTDYEFDYDGSGTTPTSGTLTGLLLPYKGWLSWAYSNTTYTGSRIQQEVSTRVLNNGSATTYYPIYHESGTSSLTLHACTTVDDPTGGVGEKYWTFSASGANQGLATYYQGRAPGSTTCSSTPASTAMTQNYFIWTQDSAGNNYIGEVDTTADLGASYAPVKKTTQTVDTHGNVTVVNNFDWGGSSSARTYNYYYSTSFTNIFNRLTSATVTHGSTTLTLASISYDQTSLASASGGREWDSGYSSVTARGNATTMTDVSGNTTTISYDLYGDTVGTSVNGVPSSASVTSTTNFAVPDSITVNSSLTTSMSYNSFLGVTSEVGPNSTAIGTTYDSTARPSSSTSPFTATTYYAYNDTASPPNVCASVLSRWSQTFLDGLGRTSSVWTGSYASSGQTGCSSTSGTTTVSETDTSYSFAGVSPTGKMTSHSVPYTTGGSSPSHTNYTYDGIGRTLTMAAVGAGSAPDTQGTTTYSYAGNTVTVTDPAGKWKTFTMDAFGNLTQVTEPKPATDTSSWSGNYVSTYTYDLLNNMTGVSMTRSTGTQTRSFAYTGNHLTSATNAENGTVTYTYISSGNGIGKVYSRTDAKGQAVVYTYDSLSRLSEVQRYPSGLSGGEDTCQRETYYYDGSGPVSSTYPTNAAGHLSAVQYKGGYNFGSPACDTTFTEWYTYGVPGAPTGKQLQASRNLYVTGVGLETYTTNFTAAFGYDTEGRMLSLQYPTMTDNFGNTSTGPSLGYTYNSMGRSYTMTDTGAGHTLISSASYGPANELTNITGTSYSGSYSETRTYNSLKQLKEVNSSGLDIQYNYPSTANNGKIVSQTDVVSGEQVNYTYDALNRLASAWTSDTTKWGLNYAYDGFGNLTSEATFQGALTQPSLTKSYDASNHAGGEDSNGNPGSIYLPAVGSSYTATYDVENRLVSTGSSAIFYGYAPGNKRVWKGTGSYITHSSGGTGQCNTDQWSTDEVTFWGVNGQKLATFQLTESPSGYYSQCEFSATAGGTSYYFGGRLLKNAGGWIYSDRLGSIGKSFPYGEERPSATTNGTEKFTGYFRDSETGNDYAVNRYMTPGQGRFITPDRAVGGARTGDPGTWNKYAYTGGDPINRIDPSGTDYIECDQAGGCWPAPFLGSDTTGFDLAVAEIENDPNTPCYGSEGIDPSNTACFAFLSDAFPTFLPPPDPTPPAPAPTDPIFSYQSISFADGESGTLITNSADPNNYTFEFQSGSGILWPAAEGACAAIPGCIETAGVGGILIYIGAKYGPTLISDINNWFSKEPNRQSQAGQQASMNKILAKYRQQCGATLTAGQKKQLEMIISHQDYSEGTILEIIKDQFGCPHPTSGTL